MTMRREGGVRWFPLSQSRLSAFVHFFLGPQSCECTWVSWFKWMDPQKQVLLLKPYILDSYGVSHSSFWSEGPKNHLNFGLKVCPPGPRGGHTSDFEGQRQGTLRCAAWTSRDLEGRRTDLEGGGQCSCLGRFYAPPTKRSYTTPHYYPKFEI